MKLLRSLMQTVILLFLSESVFADVTLTSKRNGPDIFPLSAKVLRQLSITTRATLKL